MVLGRIVVGVVVLLVGRKLFWLFVAILGFMAGMNFVPALLHNQPQWVIVGLALAAGALGALLALAFQTVAIGLAGFVGGMYVVLFFLAGVGWNPNPATSWVGLLVGGVVGVVLMFLIFDWTLIALSSLIGAILIVESTGIRGAWGGTLAVACLAVGLIVQGARLLRERR